MVEAICINDKNKPKEIPQSKWLKEGSKYNVIYTCKCLPSNDIGCHLSQIDLDETCNPYTYFKLNRFAFTEENLKKLIELIKECTETDFSLEQLLEQTELQEV